MEDITEPLSNSKCSNKEAKLSFVKKYFSDATNSPGGTIKLHTALTQTSDKNVKNTTVRPGRKTSPIATFIINNSSKLINNSSKLINNSSKFVKRKTELQTEHDHIFLSPSKRRKFDYNLDFWKQKEIPGSGYLTEQSGGLAWKPEGQQNGGGNESDE